MISYCTKSLPSIEVLWDKLGRECFFILELLVFENFEEFSPQEFELGIYCILLGLGFVSL